MITFQEATDIIRLLPCSMGTERVRFTSSLHRILASDIHSDIDSPPFNKSAMDGYACRKKDIHIPLSVIEEIPAGVMPKKTVTEGTCSRIMTGAPLPEGADCVIIDEEVRVDDSDKVFFLKSSTKTNVCYQGEDIKEGQLLIKKGTLIKPEHIAIMASAGAIQINVAIQPRIAVFSTGDELVEPQSKPTGSAIRNSNSYQIIAQLLKDGLPAKYLGIIADTDQDTETAIREALETNDVVILSGGVSMGDYDFIPTVLERCGVKVLFHRLAVQPGKPSLLGKTENNKYIFGLPGNPVSSFIQTELLVKLLINTMQGNSQIAPKIQLPLSAPYNRKRTERESFVPVKIIDSKIHTIEYHGSAHIQALSSADAVMTVPIGVAAINEGDFADVRFF